MAKIEKKKILNLKNLKKNNLKFIKKTYEPVGLIRAGFSAVGLILGQKSKI